MTVWLYLRRFGSLKVKNPPILWACLRTSPWSSIRVGHPASVARLSQAAHGSFISARAATIPHELLRSASFITPNVNKLVLYNEQMPPLLPIFLSHPHRWSPLHPLWTPMMCLCWRLLIAFSCGRERVQVQMRWLQLTMLPASLEELLLGWRRHRSQVKSFDFHKVVFVRSPQ